jgi:hypothetical protein
VIHRELAMCAVAVEKKGLEEDREEPVADEESRDREHHCVASFRLVFIGDERDANTSERVADRTLSARSTGFCRVS